MMELTVNSSEQFVIDTEKNEVSEYKLQVAPRSKSAVIITVQGSKNARLDLDVSVGDSSDFTLLVINHNEAELEINERYSLYAYSKTVVAHCDLNGYDATVNSGYTIKEEGASLLVQTASLTSGKVRFNQNCIHEAGNSEAHVNNYGVVLAHGNCDMVVKNTIVKGAHGSSTHQTSRLLTYDKTSVGKILPVLYIYDNDVAASHAASLGQPDSDQLYYLQSRGLSSGEALKLIIIGYLLPITTVISDEQLGNTLKDEIEMKVGEACSM